MTIVMRIHVHPYKATHSENVSPSQLLYQIWLKTLVTQQSF